MAPGSAIMPWLKFAKVIGSYVTMFMGQTIQSVSVTVIHLLRIG